jgi:HEAT repeat protein
MLFLAIETWAQMPSVHVPNREAETSPAASAAAPPMEDDTWWYVTVFLLVLGLAGALMWWYNTKKAEQAKLSSGGRQSAQTKNKTRETDSVDAEKEMEWYRKNQKSMGKKEVNKFRKNSPQVGDPLVNPAMPRKLETEASSGEIRIWKFEELPISSFSELKPAAEYDLLPLSNDPALMSAIEQTQDEFEEDEEVRGLALRILTAFKSRNAAEALGQIALYDISSNLRSKAATTLAEFDHESVFENLLLACADPTREVRAAAARGLFRLSFDRADAWTRIAETRDEFRMRQAARAAAEADLVERSFDRLIHPDRKVAYEAFALTALLIKAGESERIFAAIEKHRDTKVKLALLHVLSVVKDEETLPNLYALLEQNSISPEIKAKADQIIHSFDLVPA